MDRDFTRLSENIRDSIVEEQLKLGYQKEKVRLYYPLQSLNRFLGLEMDEASMGALLQAEFVSQMKDIWGRLDISWKKERFCILIPETGVEYIHETASDSQFLAELIEMVRHHGTIIEDIRSVFEKYSDNIHFEEVTNGEFDYLLYFEDGQPDGYYYCLANEGGHMTYHRYTPEDYRNFGF